MNYCVVTGANVIVPALLKEGSVKIQFVDFSDILLQTKKTINNNYFIGDEIK